MAFNGNTQANLLPSQTFQRNQRPGSVPRERRLENLNTSIVFPVGELPTQEVSFVVSETSPLAERMRTKSCSTAADSPVQATALSHHDYNSWSSPQGSVLYRTGDRPDSPSSATLIIPSMHEASNMRKNYCRLLLTTYRLMITCLSTHPSH